MILVDALLNLFVPDPTPAELVPVSPLCEEDVALHEPKGLNLFFVGQDRLDLTQVEVTTLDVSDSQVGHLSGCAGWSPLLVLCDPALDLSNLLQYRPAPPLRKRRQISRSITVHLAIPAR